MVVLVWSLLPAIADADLQDEVERAASIIERFEEIPETAIPTQVLHDVKGLAVLTICRMRVQPR